MMRSTVMNPHSPLRYPGGKARLRHLVESLARESGLDGGLYVEPFAGGASVALHMLFSGAAGEIWLNDLDESLYAFWDCVLNRTSDLCALIQQVPLTIKEWLHQRDLYRSGDGDALQRGFATFYLNRTNRSGIIAGAGVIGGLSQSGNYTMDARFPREALIERIQTIAAQRERIRLTNLDAVDLLSSMERSARTFVYLDPPYFQKADRLYASWYQPKEHTRLRDAVARLELPWVLSYDDHEEIRSLYRGFNERRVPLQYSVRGRREAEELVYCSEGLRRMLSRKFPKGATSSQG